VVSLYRTEAKQHDCRVTGDAYTSAADRLPVKLANDEKNQPSQYMNHLSLLFRYLEPGTDKREFDQCQLF
jgi:hypothetical protein